MRTASKHRAFLLPAFCPDLVKHGVIIGVFEFLGRDFHVVFPSPDVYAGFPLVHPFNRTLGIGQFLVPILAHGFGGFPKLPCHGGGGVVGFRVCGANDMIAGGQLADAVVGDVELLIHAGSQKAPAGQSALLAFVKFHRFLHNAFQPLLRFLPR